MGRKKKNREDDEDYFSSLASSSTTQVATGAAEEEDEAAVAAAQARAERAARAAEEKRAAEAAAARERAEKAALAKAMMAKRSKKGVEEEEEAVKEEDAGDEEVDGGEEEEVEAAVEELSLAGRALVALRPYTYEAGLIAMVAKVLVAMVLAFASRRTKVAVDRRLVATNPQIAAEAERKRRDCLYAPGNGYFEKRAAPALPTVTMRDDAWHRLQRNFKTRNSNETWLRVKDGDGWATSVHSQPLCLALFEGRLFECTDWLASHLLDVRDAAPDFFDSAKPLFTVSRDDQGRAVATLAKKLQDDLKRRAQLPDDDQSAPTKQPKTKLSKAEKKAKKLAYGR